MNTPVFSICCAAAIGWLPAVRAQFISLNWAVGQAIPDGSAVGVADSRIVNDAGGAIGSLRVTLDIAGRGGAAFNGDLYVTLVHDTGFAVLLNRVGRRVGDPLGYGDNGLAVTFSDALGLPDIHRYRLDLTGSDSTPLGGPLAGTWSPDARGADPDLVLTTDDRLHTLAGFRGLNPNGRWTLFVADMEPGNLAMLNGWGLEIVAVPEPATFAAWHALGCVSWLLATRRRRPPVGLQKESL